jgi:hypothetical protein
MTSQSSTELLAKLQAINKVNLEIWERIAAIDSELQNEAYLVNVETLQSVHFSSHNLTLTFGTSQIKISPFTSIFTKKMNFFNDELPKRRYFDLTDVIDKYNYLDKSMIYELLMSWKVSLEECQQILGECETKIIEAQSLNTQVSQMLFPNGNQNNQNNNNNNNNNNKQNNINQNYVSPTHKRNVMNAMRERNNGSRSEQYTALPKSNNIKSNLSNFRFTISDPASETTNLKLLIDVLHLNYTLVKHGSRH